MNDADQHSADSSPNEHDSLPTEKLVNSDDQQQPSTPDAEVKVSHRATVGPSIPRRPGAGKVQANPSEKKKTARRSVEPVLPQPLVTEPVSQEESDTEPKLKAIPRVVGPSIPRRPSPIQSGQPSIIDPKAKPELEPDVLFPTIPQLVNLSEQEQAGALLENQATAALKSEIADPSILQSPFASQQIEDEATAELELSVQTSAIEDESTAELKPSMQGPSIPASPTRQVSPANPLADIGSEETTDLKAGSRSNLSHIIPSRPLPTKKLPDRVPQSGLLPFHKPRFITNTLQAVRGFSEKMAAVVGHTYLPPEPPLERYRPPTSALPGAPVEKNVSALKVKPWRRSRRLRIVKQMRNRRARWKTARPQFRQIWTGILIALLVLIVVTSFSGTAYAYTYYQNQQPELKRISSAQIFQTTRIYDRNGVLLYDAYDPNKGRRTPITYKDIPKVMQDAMIATEDKSFWTNIGVDPQAILRAYSNGPDGGGASGITQQVVKNITGNTQNTYDRKLSEAAVAIGLTQQYPKWKILEMYFNVAPFGAQDHGVEAAVEEYFGLAQKCDGKFNCTPAIAHLDYESDANPHDPLLALARATLLAGMPQKPGTNDPTLGEAAKQHALLRQKDILDLMIGLDMSYGPGKITPAIAQQVEDRTAKMTFKSYQHIERAPHFVEWIKSQVETSLGADGVYAFLNGGFNIRTTIDVNLEEYVERAVQRHITQPEQQKLTGQYVTLNDPHWNVNNGAVVVMDAKTGEVLAMDGSTDFNSTDPKINGEFNVAINARPPGSTFKPIVYATAFEMGWYPGIVLPDVRTYFPNGMPQGTHIPYSDKDTTGTWAPHDYGGSYNNKQSSVRYATANSFNIPALKAMSYAGPENVLATAQRMGITSLSLTGGIAWGIGSSDVPLLQMVGAYQTFADNGLHVPPQGVLDMWDNYGHQLYHYDTSKPPTSQILSPQVSYMMTSVLMDEPSRSYEFESDHDLSFADIDANCAYMRACEHQVATKTGTTDDFKDNWTIGYTSDVVVGVWVGNADNSPMHGVIGITGAAPIWHSVMERVNGVCNKDVQNRNTFASSDGIDCGSYQTPYTIGKFPIPGGIHQAPANTYNGLAGSGPSDWMLDNQDPQQSAYQASK